MIIQEKIIKHLRRSGYLKDLSPDEDPTDSLFDEEPTYASCMSASVRQRIALGSVFGYEGEIPELKGRLCAFVGGFSLIFPLQWMHFEISNTEQNNEGNE